MQSARTDIDVDNTYKYVIYDTGLCDKNTFKSLTILLFGLDNSQIGTTLLVLCYHIHVFISRPVKRDWVVLNKDTPMDISI